ncbi:MAG: L,D-transpeptidase family protein [Actinobacteria bacterium]|nr:L,D-transpeptidase family protein [Actinomycetota bacterium]MCG2819120.1 L,D-transpeptidase family protein [Actinomycetes bacterium]MBU4218727.1 L,D-transpeptidase family protein [Actinomycetota bacterium]MBU4359456.1 L,D-transpeptidase family protein [Actinomycetota bacterium]MBU4391327.1 L,D-transpeptidase family protein [Actinomycetota bacterium]
MLKKSRLVPAVTIVALVLTLVAPALALAGSPRPPTDLVVNTPDSSAGGCLKLAWRVEDPGDIGEYRIYRSAEPDSGFRRVFSGDVDMTRPTRMDHVDTGLDDGSTYYYKVTLVGKDGKESDATDVAKAELPERPRGTEGGQYAKRIVLSSLDQRAYFLENEVCVKSHLISTGTASHPTPHGLFSVLYHEYLLISEKYGDAYCYWWMGFYTDTGMHALPYNPSSGTYTGANQLGQPASHGCVRQAVADAEWAYKWAPDGTRIDVIGWHFDPTEPKPPTPPITGGHSSRGVSEVANEWYFAEGCTSGEFNEYLLMMNPNAVPASVEATYMLPDGSVLLDRYTVPPFSRFTVHVDDVPGLESTEVSVRLVSDQVIAAERSMYFDYNERTGGSNSIGVNAPKTTWYLAEGYTGGQFDEFILVQNPGIYDGTVRVQYMRSDGQNFTVENTIKAHSRLSLHVDDIPGLQDAEVSAKLTCDEPVVAERAQYFDYYGKQDGNTSVAIDSPSKTWYVAEGYTGGDFDEYVLIQNPNDEAVTAEVTFMRSDGRNFYYEYGLLPNSRFSIHVDDLPDLESAEVSTYVNADSGVIVERSMYFNSYGRPGGADAPGVPEPARSWSLAEGYTGGEYDTYVLIMNPNNEEVTVAVNYLLPGVGIHVASYDVGPNSRYTIHVDEIEGLTDTELSTTLGCDLPIICERAMYFSIPRD